MRILLLCLALVCGTAWAETYREFTSKDGKKMLGQVKAYDAQSQTVTIERDNKRIFKVSVTVFSDEDQAYILEWDAAKGFLSESLLRIKCDRKRINQRKEKTMEDVRISGGGGDTMNVQLKETTFESTVFEIEFSNKGDSDLKDIRIEYVVYYEQSEGGWQKPEVVQKRFTHKDSMADISADGKSVVTTKPVEIFSDNITFNDWAADQTLYGGKGEVHGMRARLYMKMPSGKEVERRFCFPDKLSDVKHPWRAR
jgi:hypothetical protein